MKFYKMETFTSYRIQRLRDEDEMVFSSGQRIWIRNNIINANIVYIDRQ